MRSLIREHLISSLSGSTGRGDYSLVLDRASFLEPTDRYLLDAILSKNLSASQLAALCDMSPRLIRYRVRILCRRVLSRPYINAVRTLPHLDEQTRELVVRHMLRRQPVKQIARQMNLSLHHVRHRLAVAEGAIAERALLDSQAMPNRSASGIGVGAGA